MSLWSNRGLRPAQALLPAAGGKMAYARRGPGRGFLALQIVVLGVVLTAVVLLASEIQALRADVNRINAVRSSRMISLRRPVSPDVAFANNRRAVRQPTPARVATSSQLVQITFSMGSLEYQFGPKGLSVHRGAWVTWVNTTPEAHSVTMAAPGLLPVIVPPHSRVTLVFPYAGRYPYYCSFHPYQHGEVTVTR